MAGIKISDLPAVVTPALTDIFPIDQGLVTYKETAQQLLTLFQANGAALTKTDDTNVTMTLGGSPTIALLNATSLTLGWTGQLSVGRGGTGNSTFTAYAVICAGTTATGAFQNVSGVGTAGQVLTSNGAAALPTWQAAAIAGAALTKTDDTNVTLTLGGSPATALVNAASLTLGWTGQLSVSRGGTGQSSLTAHYLLIGNGTSAVTLLAPSATSGIPLISQGAASDPAYGTAVVAGGGTGNTTFTAYAVICAGTTATGAFQNVSGVGSANQVLVSNGAGALPSWQAVPGLTPAALTKTDDTNVTLTLGGTPSTALLQASSITAGWTGQLGLTRGGTNASLTASNGGVVYSTSSALAILSGTATANLPLLSGSSAAPSWGSFALSLGGALTTAGGLTTSGAFGATFTFTNTTSVTFPTSGTLATTSQIPTGAALTKTDDTNVTLTLGGSPTTALVNAASITAGWTGQLGLTRGGTAASLTASNGGIVYSTSSALAILSGTATAGQILQSGSSAAPAWSTATFPSTATGTGKILRADGTNWAASTATFADTYTASNLLYSNGSNTVTGLATANNGILVTNGSGVPSISSTVPAFTTSSITFNPTTSGIVGTTTNDSASAGYVGEYISSTVASGSAVSLTSGAAKTMTSISLTAGDWDVWLNIGTLAGAGTITQGYEYQITNTADSIVGVTDAYPYAAFPYTTPANQVVWCSVGPSRISVSGTTTIYGVARCSFTVSTLKTYGSLSARRVR